EDSGPGPRTSPELLEREEADAPGSGGPAPRGRRVVSPGGQEQADVGEVVMRGHVLERLQPVLHEPQPRPAAAAGAGGEEPPQVVALVTPRLLALDARRMDVPGVQDPPAELALFGGDDHRRGWLGHQPM